jgi:CBS domain-containing protein
VGHTPYGLARAREAPITRFGAPVANLIQVNAGTPRSAEMAAAEDAQDVVFGGSIKKGRSFISDGMADMKAADIMVTTVVTVGPECSIENVADTLLENHVSAVPVVSNGGDLVGIVSEGDLIRRTEIDTERRRSRWLALLIGIQPLAAEFVKSHAGRVADVMTRDVIVATPDTPLRHIAALLEKNGIKRVPIVSNGKLVGIVSRANLVQALASARKQVKASAATSDLLIREELLSRLHAEPWARTSRLNVIVHDGTVELWGTVRSRAEKQAIRLVAEATSGVRAVNDNIIVESIMFALQHAIA